MGFLLPGHPSLVSNCGSVKPCESQSPPSSLLSVFVSYCISAVYFTVFPALKKRSIQTGWLPFLLVWPGTPQLPTVRNSSIQESGRLSINKQQVSWITPCGRYSLLVGGGAGVVNCPIRIRILLWRSQLIISFSASYQQRRVHSNVLGLEALREAIV